VCRAGHQGIKNKQNPISGGESDRSGTDVALCELEEPSTTDYA